MSNMSRLAEQHAECPLSYKPLYQGPVAVFMDSKGKRTGTLFYREDAAKDWLSSQGNVEAKDPETGATVASYKVVPSILDDPKNWFRLCDADGNRKLSREEVVTALKAQLPLDNRAIDRFKTNDAAWDTWDADHSGSIEYTEIMDDDKGLLKFVRDTFARSVAEAPVPDIRTDREAWYRRWDEDSSGELEFEEVVRAFAKSFKIDASGIQMLRMILEALWCDFDLDNSRSVDREEFLKPRDGLADTIIANLGFA
eukprot:TRINITY_DN53846_c0_g1_i1.p1 TRINITY_DN53846_c0_g1~~TRINITY_DN53846_c0_g1_i1.p1  ORF type:complete len:254 (+),score=54.61 TRINITY_DN53846_c0_g1_i1:59-820(+)